MKFFVTIGNTRFDSLFMALDIIAANSKHEFIGQIADGNYIPKNFHSFAFEKNISKQILEADAVICHAGAGSVYRLLEHKKKLIVIFNTDRVDEHQKDLAHFVKSEHLALTCCNLTHLEELIEKLDNFSPNNYIKDEFHKTEEIMNYLFD